MAQSGQVTENDVLVYTRTTIWLLGLINVSALGLLAYVAVSLQGESWEVWTDGWPLPTFLAIGPIVGLGTQGVWRRPFLPLITVVLGATLAALLVVAGGITDSPVQLVLVAFACAGPAMGVWHVGVLVQTYKHLDAARQHAETQARHEALLHLLQQIEADLTGLRLKRWWRRSP